MPGTKRIGYSHSALTAGFVVSLPRNNSRSRGVREALPSERAGGRYESGTNRTEVRTGPGLASERFGDGGARRGRAHLRRRARRGRMSARRAGVARRHAGRQAVEGGVAVRGGAAGAAGAEVVAVLGRLLMGDPRAPRDRPRGATSSPRRAASQGARQACCPA